jgi:hypothetical protein
MGMILAKHLAETTPSIPSIPLITENDGVTRVYLDPFDKDKGLFRMTNNFIIKLMASPHVVVGKLVDNTLVPLTEDEEHIARKLGYDIATLD